VRQQRRDLVQRREPVAQVLELGSEALVQLVTDLVARAFVAAGAIVRRAQGGYVRAYEAVLLAAAVALLAYWSLR
jgi:hypothetical protein